MWFVMWFVSGICLIIENADTCIGHSSVPTLSCQPTTVPRGTEDNWSVCPSLWKLACVPEKLAPVPPPLPFPGEPATQAMWKQTPRFCSAGTERIADKFYSEGTARVALSERGLSSQGNTESVRGTMNASPSYLGMRSVSFDVNIWDSKGGSYCHIPWHPKVFC